jgi:hypothetical protein
MRPDFLTDTFPPAETKAPAGRVAGSPATGLTWFLAVAFIGFAVTSAVIWFGPGAVDYVKDLRWPSFEFARKSKSPSRWKSPIQAQYDRVRDAVSSPGYSPPTMPPMNFPRVDHIPAPNTHGGIRSVGSRILQ